MESANSKHAYQESLLTVVSRIFVLSIGATSLLLLFPTWSKLSVFAKGEFAFIESVGLIFLYLTLLITTLLFLSKKFSSFRIQKQLIRLVFYAGTIGLNVFMLLFVIMFIWIRFDVKTHCEDAKKTYGGTCVDALSRQLDDRYKGYSSRNAAIWTLGQLADKKSLPILKKYYTGKIPSREPLNKMISQYELEKAIRWCEKGNITSWMYRGL